VAESAAMAALSPDAT